MLVDILCAELGWIVILGYLFKFKLKKITVIPFVIFQPKSGLFIIFSRGTWQRPTVWTINIYRYHFIFYWVFFRWKKKKLQSKNLIHPSINDYLLLKTWGEHDNGQEIFLILIYRGTWQRGNMAKGITVNHYLPFVLSSMSVQCNYIWILLIFDF